MSDVASPPRRRDSQLELDPDATPRKPTRLPPVAQCSPLKAASILSDRTATNVPALSLQINSGTPLGSGLPSPNLSFTLPDVDSFHLQSGSDISESEATDAGSSGVSQRGGLAAPSRASAFDGYSSESSACMDSEDDANKPPKIAFQEAPRLRSGSLTGGGRLRRVPSPSPQAIAAQASGAADDGAGSGGSSSSSSSWSRSFSLFRRKRSAPDLRSVAREKDSALRLPPLPSAQPPLSRIARALSIGPSDEPALPFAKPPRELKTKSSMKSLRSRSPFRPQTPGSPPLPTPPPLPLDEDPFACLPTASRPTSPHPSATRRDQRRTRPSKASTEAGQAQPARRRSCTSPSSTTLPPDILGLYLGPQSSLLHLDQPVSQSEQLRVQQSSLGTPVLDASDSLPDDGRGRTRSYGGDRPPSRPPPVGPNRSGNGSSRPSLLPSQSNGKGDEEDDDRERPPPRRAAARDFSESELSSSDDSSSDNESDFRTPLETAPNDDDVPLAVAHPTTALKAQKSLRLTRRKEKTEERQRRKAERKRVESPPSRRRPGLSTASSNALPSQPKRLPKDLPSAYGVAGMDGVFRADELERKLRDLELSGGAAQEWLRAEPPVLASGSRSRQASESQTPASAFAERVKGSSMPPVLSRKASAPNLAVQPAYGMQSSGSLSRTRSQSAAKSSLKVPAPPWPVRQFSATRPHSPTCDASAVPMQRKASEPLPSAVGRQHSLSAASRRPQVHPADIPPLPPLPGASTNFPSPVPPTQSSSASNSRRPTLTGLGPVPELDRLRIVSNPPRSLSVTLEHADVARSLRIDVPDSITAGGLLEVLIHRGDLPSARTGETMLKGRLAVWERGDEWNVERPLRDYEVLSQVIAAWNPVKRENTFVVKRCAQGEFLSTRAIPNQCPNVIGWVQVFSARKKKWSKRFLEVRNGAVCLAKNERGKDEQHLCTLTAFDFYLMTQVPAKAPKGHYFALKSQDQFAFFEDSSDYIHLFATDSRTFESFYRGILQARSHALLSSNPGLFQALSPTSASSPRGPSASASPVMADLASFGAVRRPSAGSGLSPGGSSGALPDASRSLWQKGSLLSKMSRGER